MILLISFLSLFLGLVFLKINLVIAIIVLIIAFLFILKRFKRRGLIFFVIFFSLGIGISQIRIISSAEKTNYQGFVIEAKDNYFILNSCFEKLYIYEKDNEREVGDYINAIGVKKELSFETIESSFDFNEYLLNKGIYHELEIKSYDVLFANFIKLKAYRHYFLSHFSENTKALLNSLLFGIKDYENITVQSLEKMNILHILSMSGLFLNLLMSIFAYLLELKLKSKWSRLISIFIVLIYSLFTFPRFVVIRIAMLFIFRWINDFLLKKKFTNIELISILGILCLFFNYYLAYQASFYLGFMASILINFTLISFGNYSRFRKRICITLVLFFAFLPYSVSVNHELSLLSPIYQIILFPFIAFIGLISFISLFTFPFSYTINFFSNGFSSASIFFSKHFYSLYMPEVNAYFILAYYGLFFFSLYAFQIKFKPLFKFVSFFCVLSIVIVSLPIMNYLYYQVSFINVGQGDSILISLKGKTVLVDTGGSKYKDIANDCLIPFFKKNQVYKIDYLITTHDDFDHSGAKEKLMNNFPVLNYIDSNSAFPLNVNGVTFQNLNQKQTDDKNASSLVIYFELMSKKWLLMGDAPKDVEETIIRDNPSLDVDILKVGHHGSNSSTSKQFLKAVTPLEAIISVGKNYYGHPNKEVLEMLEENEIKVRRTDSEGTITYKSL